MSELRLSLWKSYHFYLPQANSISFLLSISLDLLPHYNVLSPPPPHPPHTPRVWTMTGEEFYCDIWWWQMKITAVHRFIVSNMPGIFYMCEIPRVLCKLFVIFMWFLFYLCNSIISATLMLTIRFSQIELG